MGNTIVFVKLNLSAPSVHHAINYVEESFQHKVERHYYTSGADTAMLTDLKESIDNQDFAGQRIVFIIYRKTTDIFIHKLYVGEFLRLEMQGGNYKIHYQIKDEITSPLVIDNFMIFSNLNIEKDFSENSHVSIENSPALAKQLRYAITSPKGADVRTIEYTKFDGEDNLSEFAQRNEYCKRIYNFFEQSLTRSEFQRDYDRIIHSKAFRRMVDKAQIFTSSKGDHYRTRMTHTLCVTQIAQGIADRLKMNVPLTEAIALGHDLGHTPFGHQGERTLNKRMKDYGGFKHNYQSLNVVSVLEEEYIEGSGLDLSVQVLEGLWKHTKIRKKHHVELLCDINEFLPSEASEEQISLLHPEWNFCSTIEGQIVFIADEIAQRSHDLDDALSAGLISVDGLLEILSLKKLKFLKSEIEKIKTRMHDAESHNRCFISTDELLASRISSRVINYFIDDVVKHYFSVIDSNTEKINSAKEYFRNYNRVNCQIIDFSEDGQVLNNYLDTIVKKLVINSAEVAAFDDKAERIVKKLFDLYCENPRLLHEGTLQRIYIAMRKKTPNVIHFQDGDIDLVNDEWKRIKNPEKSPRVRDLRETFPEMDLESYKDVFAFKDSLEQSKEKLEFVEKYIADCISEYEEKRKILYRAICDFISGMTDSYAINEYRKLLC